MSKGRGERYIHLLKDKDVKRWYENMARGSVVTADGYLRKLGNFCKSYNITPKTLIKMGDKKRYNFLMDAVSDLEEKEHAGSYVQYILKTVKSWLAYNGITITRKIKIRGALDTPTLREERVPTQPELKKIFLSGDKQARAACVLLAHSGVRIQVLGDYKGNDGLQVGDFPELSIEGKKIGFKKTPAIVMVRKELSKAGQKYFTFLSEEGCEYLLDYLSERVRNGEKLTENSAVITPKTPKKPFVSSTNIGDIIRKPLRSTGFQWRPYVLRSYFDTQLMLAESKGLVLRDYRTFWMGHKGDIEHTYTTNKGRLANQVIEDMREAYRRSEEFLQTKTPGLPKEKDLKRMFTTELLKIAGYTEKEIEKMKTDNLSDDEVKKVIRDRLLGLKMHNSNGNGNGKQLAVTMDEIDKHLSNGWEYVTTLPNNKVIIRAPLS